MQQTHSHHPIVHILDPQHLPHQPVTIHMPAAEPKPRPSLDLLHQPLALHAVDREANHRDANRLARARVSVDSDAVVAVEVVEEDRLQLLLVVGDLLPRGRRVRTKVLHDARDAVREFVVCGCQIELQVEGVRSLEEMAEAVDLVVHAARGVELRNMRSVDLVP